MIFYNFFFLFAFAKRKHYEKANKILGKQIKTGLGGEQLIQNGGFFIRYM